MQDYSTILTPRWTKLHYHRVQQSYFKSESRFCICHAGRRAGKTELAKRRIVLRAMDFELPNGRFVCSAPTHRQSIDIFWQDLIDLVPRWALYNQSTKSISISFRRIKLFNGATLEVFGMDKSERIEGPILDGFLGDEFGNFKSDVWAQNIRPALSTIGRPGFADLTGTPEGKNHYFQITEDAKGRDDWSVYTWHADEINKEESDIAKGELDAITYNQEYGGEFVSFKGRTYYAFDEQLNIPPEGKRVLYHKNFQLSFCFDFNRVPGNCVIVQELPAHDWLLQRNQGKNRGLITCVIDEIFFQQDSNTEKLCDELIKRWRNHTGVVKLYGDATGGAKQSSAVAGSDWDIINAKLAPHFQLDQCYPKSNPRVRVRINSVNSRLVAADGYIGTIVDRKCKFLIRDFESVTCDDTGDILKSDTKSLLTHISDGFGYYICVEHPLGGEMAFSNKEYC